MLGAGKYVIYCLSPLTALSLVIIPTDKGLGFNTFKLGSIFFVYTSLSVNFSMSFKVFLASLFLLLCYIGLYSIVFEQ